MQFKTQSSSKFNECSFVPLRLTFWPSQGRRELQRLAETSPAGCGHGVSPAGCVGPVRDRPRLRPQRAPAAPGETDPGGARQSQRSASTGSLLAVSRLQRLWQAVSVSADPGQRSAGAAGRCQPRGAVPPGRARSSALPGNGTGTGSGDRGRSAALFHGRVSQPCTDTSLMTVGPCAVQTAGLRMARRVYSALLLPGVTSTMKYSSRYHRSKSDDKSKGFFEGNFCVFLRCEWQFHWVGKYIWILVWNTSIQSSGKQSEVNTTCNVIYVCYLHEFSGLIPHYILLKLCYEDEVIPFQFLNNVPDRQNF